MNISIAVIKVNSVNNLGSLNIGKTILSRNTASMQVYPAPAGVPQSAAANNASEVDDDVH